MTSGNLMRRLVGNNLVEIQEDSQVQTKGTPMIYGLQKWIVLSGIWVNIIFMALYLFKKPLKAFTLLRKLQKARKNFRANQTLIKFVKTDRKYHFTFNSPGWPSSSFNQYIRNNLRKLDPSDNSLTLDSLLFGITKKCGYQCEHCFEWDSLNHAETLSRKDLVSIIHSFQSAGIAQVHLSGGEPLNRFDDIIHILENVGKQTEVWVYTSGYHLTEERATALKRNGCTGVTVSLDHWIPELHDHFRGKQNAFDWARRAINNASKAKLVVSVSLCATKEFISENNLYQFAEMAKKWGVGFIQVLEPKAVGHYSGKDICLSEKQIAMLEDFYLKYNHDKKYRSYPSIIYHGFYSRRVGCNGGGKHYVYVDTDGDVHNCPFCQRKVFSALSKELEANLRVMSAGGCKAFIKS